MTTATDDERKANPDVIFHDFVARRYAAINAERIERAEWDMERNFERDLALREHQFEYDMERECETRDKYAAAIAETRARRSLVR